MSKQRKSEESVSLKYISPFEHFEPRQEKFYNYLERFENLHTTKGLIVKESVAKHLCVSIGSVLYNALSAFLKAQRN